jgi:septum formation protein
VSADPLILASASPRRADLLRAAGLAFRVEPSRAEESYERAWSPAEVAQRLAERKAEAVARLHEGECAWVIGADTVVAVEVAGELRLLGKPADEAEARRMLGWLSGSHHEVVTGVCVRACGSERGARSAFERTLVRMRPIRPAEIEAYAASGEWRDKAGGYAIQESADAFVTGLSEGGFDNVVGLPVALTLRLLRDCGAPLSVP